MDFSARFLPLYVRLGTDAGVRRRALHDRDGVSQIEAFLGRRLHGFSTLVRIERGDGVVLGSFGSIVVGSGDLVVLPPGEVSYHFTGARRVETLALHLPSATGAVIRSTFLSRELFSKKTPEILDELRAAPARATFQRVEGERTAMSAFAAITNAPAGVRLSAVAHDLGYTAGGLADILQRTTGRGFSQWRDALAMTDVRSRLASTATVLAIARELSMDATYLHRRFVRAHGTTPQRWRKRAPSLPPSAVAHDWDELVRCFG